MNNKEFLDNLAVGDTVVVESNDRRNLTKVVRFTKTQIVTTKGSKFSRDTGTNIGGDHWNHSFLQEPTQERLDKIRHSILVIRLKHVDWKSLSLDVLHAFAALLAEKTGE